MAADLLDPALLQFGSLASADEQLAFAMAMPGLFSPEYQAGVLARRPGDAACEEAVVTLRAIEAGVRAGQLPYRLDAGPLDRLLDEVDAGAITEALALQRAATPALAAQLSPLYVRALLTQVFGSLGEGPVEPVWLRMRLLRSAVQAREPGLEARALARSVDEDFLKVAQWYLCSWADGRVRAEAVRIGEALLACTDLPAPRRGTVLHVLGTLHLDPYASGRSTAGYRSQIQHWMRRFLDAHRNELAGVPNEQWQMPRPLEALGLAEAYLRQAVPLREGHEKGLTLKALAQTLLWWSIAAGYDSADGTADEAAEREDEMVPVAREALEHLDEARDPQQVVATLAMLEHADADADTAGLDALLRDSPDHCVQMRGPLVAHDLFAQAAALLRHRDAGQALQVAEMARCIDEIYKNEAGHRAILDLEMQLLTDQGGLQPQERSDAQALRDAVARVREQGGACELDVQQAAATLLDIAIHSSAFNEEAWGLRVLALAAGLAPIFARRYAPVFQHVRANLYLGLGVNAFDAEDYGEAVLAYGQAVRESLPLGHAEYALHCADRIGDCVAHSQAGVVEELTQALLGFAGPLLQHTGDAGRAHLLAMCASALKKAGQKLPLDVFRLMQFAKGFEFSAALVAGVGHVAEAWPEQAELLAAVAAAEDEAQHEPGAAEPLGAMARELQVVAFTSAAEASGGDSAQDRLLNLKRGFDAQLNARLLAEVRGASGLLLGVEQVQAALDPQTVLLNFYLGADDKGQVAVQLLLISRERIGGARISHPFPTGFLQMGVEGRTLHLDPLAMLVASAREMVQAPSGPAPANRKALADLQTALPSFFGDAAELDRFRAEGKRHLCIVPHGALHYYPFHLIDYHGEPLAAQWAVSMLPHLNLLVAGRGRPTMRGHRAETLAAVGLSYRDAALNPAGLVPLDDAVAEAREVAAVFGVAPLLEAQATQAAVQAVLTRSRFVHLSMHGRQDAEAPAFHCLHAAPDANSDGRICAHEVLGWDLRAVDLLTLSACETGLGRFDMADNLRGLPASFFLAGVSTLVGTLWEVNAAATRFFFVRLYEGLKAEQPRMQAFWAAQTATRQQFPRYADWGAFFLAGEWR